MVEPGGELDLAVEALGGDRGGELGGQQLERHRAGVAEVFIQVDRRHAALAELALEAVAGGERVPEGGEVGKQRDCRHR